MSSETEAPVDAAPAQQPAEQKQYPSNLTVNVSFTLNEIPTLLRVAQVASQAANLELGAACAVISERVNLAQQKAAADFDLLRTAVKDKKKK